MRFLILLFVLFGLSISCGKKRGKFKYHSGEEDTGITIEHLDNSQTKVEVDKMFVLVRKNGNQRRRIHLVCRGMEGCLHICNHFDHANFDHATCKQLAVSQVIDFWITRISEYNSWKEAHKDLTFIATNKDVADFIKVMDKKGRVMKSLFHIGAAAVCPVSGHLAVRHSPFASLYIVQPADAKAEVAASELNPSTKETAAAKSALPVVTDEEKSSTVVASSDTKVAETPDAASSADVSASGAKDSPAGDTHTHASSKALSDHSTDIVSSLAQSKKNY